MAKILLVDDDVDLVTMNRIVLEKRGHQVSEAYCAGEAREWLASNTPDIVVLDVMMETQTAGIELAREINQKMPDVPILMLSCVHEATGVPFRFEPDDQWLVVNDFIDKPTNPKALADKVEDILG